jgi:2,4-diaminopentanoate dehydrogenase
MTYKIIVWGPGFIGTRALKYIADHPSMELVGVKCFSDAKDGIDAGSLGGLPPMGVTATREEASLLALDADCVLFTCGDTSMQNPAPGTLGYEFIEAMCRILESGKNVVSTTPMQMVYPPAMGALGQQLIDKLDGACAAGASTVYFVGVEPGFMLDPLATILSSMSLNLTSVRAYELVDWGRYDNHATLSALGLGGDPDDPARPFVLEVFKQVWTTTIVETAHTLNLPLDDIAIWDRPVLADETFTAPGGLEIKKGTVAVAHWALEGLVDGVPRIAIEHVNRMREDLAPELPSVNPGGGYRIEIDSHDLPLSVDFHIGRAGAQSETFSSFDNAMYGTAARAINAIEMVCDAPPGYKSRDDLPHVVGRNAFWIGQRTRPSQAV